MLISSFPFPCCRCGFGFDCGVKVPGTAVPRDGQAREPGRFRLKGGFLLADVIFKDVNTSIWTLSRGKFVALVALVDRRRSACQTILALPAGDIRANPNPFPGPRKQSIASVSTIPSRLSETMTINPPVVAVIGTGFGGLACGTNLKHALVLNNFVIIEKSNGIGGTWRNQRCESRHRPLPPGPS